MVIDSKSVKVGWHAIETLSRSLAYRIRADHGKVDYILGISRGGVVPGLIMSHMLDTRLITYGVKSYNGRQAGKEVIVTQDFDFNTLDQGSKIIVVDDKVDSGNTIDYIKSNIKDRFDLITCTLFAEDRARTKVNYYGTLLSDNSWIDFPWECV